jgi:hypothetical protein
MTDIVDQFLSDIEEFKTCIQAAIICPEETCGDCDLLRGVVKDLQAYLDRWKPKSVLKEEANDGR